MAEVLFRARLQQEREDWAAWRVESAGTWARDGDPASENSRLVMAQRGLDLSQHRSKTVSQPLLDEFDLILTMEPGHKEALQVEFPSVAARVFLLSEMRGAQSAIKDPYGGPLEGYERTAELIDQTISRGFATILSQVMARHP